MKTVRVKVELELEIPVAEQQEFSQAEVRAVVFDEVIKFVECGHREQALENVPRRAIRGSESRPIMP